MQDQGAEWPSHCLPPPSMGQSPIRTSFRETRFQPAASTPRRQPFCRITCRCPISGTNIFRAIPNEDSHENQFTLKLDHRINDKQNLSLYYYFNDGFDGQPFTRFQAATPNLLPGFGNNNSDPRAAGEPVAHLDHQPDHGKRSQSYLFPRGPGHVSASPADQPGDGFLRFRAAAAVCFTGTSDTPGVIPTDPRIGITPALGPNREGVPFVTISRRLQHRQ